MGGGGDGGVGAVGDGASETLWSVGAWAGRLRSGRPGRGGGGVPKTGLAAAADDAAAAAPL
eukprot:2154529-Prymnesium_polylepis.1